MYLKLHLHIIKLQLSNLLIYMSNNQILNQKFITLYHLDFAFADVNKALTSLF